MPRIPSTIFRRDVYIERIRPFMYSNIVKVMVGPRRVGKSYILYQIMEIIKSESASANIIYINKEDLEFDDIRDYRDLHSYVSARLVENGRNHIFVDEIQTIADFRLAIRSLALDENNDMNLEGAMWNLRYSAFPIRSSSYSISSKIRTLLWKNTFISEACRTLPICRLRRT